MAIPTLTMIPSGYKSQKVYSVLPTNGDGDFTFDRNNAGTRVNKDGLIEQVATDVPRLDYSDGSCPSLLLEPASVNLAVYSQDFSQSDWSVFDVSKSANSVLSPDGTLNGARITALDGTNKALQQLVTVSADPSNDRVFTGSIYIKSSSVTSCFLRVGSATSNNAITISNEWQRFEAQYTLAATFTAVRLGIVLNNEGDEVDVAFGQVEEKPYATSYIPTTTGSASRGADSELDSGDLSNYINSTEGVYYTEIKFDYSTERVASTGGLVLGSDNSFPSPQAIEIAMSEAGAFRIGKRDSSFTELVSLPSGVNYKVAVKWDSLNLSIYVNGVEETTSTISSTDFQYIYHSSGDSSKYIKDLRVYNTALTDAELITLTTI